jgi:hypothetical protein
MKLVELAKAIKEKPPGQTILIYGDPKSGKTALAATMAKLPWIHRIFWFDLEKGSDTILTMYKLGFLSAEEADKFEIYRIPDSPLVPRAFETIMKVLSSKKKFTICNEHGKADCAVCKEGKHEFELGALGQHDAVVIDSGSQLGDSVLNFYCAGKPLDFKPGWDEYGPQIRVLSDFMTIIQQGGTNFVVLTHILVVEEDNIDRYFPLLGTKNFSMKCAKYFDHVILTSMRAKKHEAGSSTGFKLNAITGSRSNLKMEKLDKPDFGLAFKLLQEENEGIIKVLQAVDVTA